jgi:putative transposase
MNPRRCRPMAKFQLQPNAKAVQRFLRRLINQFGPPRVVITDKLRSNFNPIRDLAPNADHRAHKGLNNRIEGSHRPTRNREKIMGRFKSQRQAQRFFATHDQIDTIFRPRRYRISTVLSYRFRRLPGQKREPLPATRFMAGSGGGRSAIVWVYRDRV